MLRLRFAPLSMTGDDAPVVMLSEAKHLIPLYCRVLRSKLHNRLMHNKHDEANNMTKFPTVQALTFDLFGTVLDLGGSLTPAIASYLRDKGSSVPPERLWNQWRARQRLEQYQDNILLLGHSGYLETVRRALIYVLALEGVDATEGDVPRLMEAWQHLNPFADVRARSKSYKGATA